MATSDGAVRMLLLGAGHYSAPPVFHLVIVVCHLWNNYCPWVVGSLALHVRNCGADRDEIIPHVLSKNMKVMQTSSCVCVWGGACVHPA